MKRFSIRLIIGLFTFLLGISGTVFWMFYSYAPKVEISDTEEIQTVCTFPNSGIVSPVPKPGSENSCNYPKPQNIELEVEEAVYLAECFIIQNGYTNLMPDKENLGYESIEWESNVDEMLKTRHDTLERKAFGISLGRKGNSVGWTVVFRYKGSKSKNGRAVTMDLDGSNARVEHVDFILAKVEKKL